MICWSIDIDGGQGGRNSLASYFNRIHLSLSSRVEVGVGLVIGPRDDIASHTEFAKLLPIASITLIWPGLIKKEKKS